MTLPDPEAESRANDQREALIATLDDLEAMQALREALIGPEEGRLHPWLLRRSTALESERQAPKSQEDVIEAAVSTGSKDTLRGIRDNPTALNADRIRATVELDKIEREERTAGSSEFEGLIRLKNLVEALPPHERGPYLDSLLAIRNPDGSVPETITLGGAR